MTVSEVFCARFLVATVERHEMSLVWVVQKARASQHLLELRWRVLRAKGWARFVDGKHRAHTALTEAL